MSSNNHREVARLDRVPLPVEAARIGVTGWQLTRTAARVLTKLPGKGPLQHKVIKQIPQTFADLGPTYVKFGQIIASSPGAFGEQLSREFRGLLDRVPPADTDEVHKLFAEELGGDPSELFASFDEEPFASASIAQVHYATLHSRRGRRRQDPAAGHPPPGGRRPADPQALRAGRGAGQAGPPAVRAGRRRRLRRQPGRGAELPPRGAVDGRLGLAPALVAARQEHPGAAGALGLHLASGC